MGNAERPVPPIDSSTPHAARIWNYWLGGKDNYAADRAAGDAVAAVYPDIVTMALESRKFLVRVVTRLATEAGMRQFLDVGTGLQSIKNSLEVAQRIAPSSRVVYVDNDPMVLAHARALLVNTAPEGVTTYVTADYHQPDPIVAEARKVLDLDEPVAVMFMGVLGYETDLDEVRRIVGHVLDAVPSGSHLVLWDGTDTGDAVVEGGEKLVESGGLPYILRSREALTSLFDGLELLKPGLEPISRWGRDAGELGMVENIDAYGAVGRKP